MPKKSAPQIEHMDPITGELETLVPEARRRIRDIFIDDLGREIPDPRPMAPPVGYTKAPSMIEIVRQQIQREMALYASDREPESLEESDDFDIPDDPADPNTPWENDFDPPWSEVRQAIEEDRAARSAASTSPPPNSSSAPEARPQPQPPGPPSAGPSPTQD